MAKLINRRALLALGTGSALTVLTTALWAAPKFLSGSITPTGNRRTRVILKANGEFKYRYFTLAKPDRLVIDIDGMVQNSALTSLAEKVQPADGFIARIRLGQKDAKTVRIVFDLKRPIQASIVRNGSSLQIDLTESTGRNAVRATTSMAAQQNVVKTTTNDDPLGEMLSNRRQSQNSSNNTNTVRKRRPIIMLDPGHGGKDPGAIGITGIKEKDITLAYARETKALLEAHGYQVYLTRNNDTFVKLGERRRKARAVKADLFISIHANASEINTARGSDVFVWGAHPNSERARKLALAENEADDVDGLPDVGNKNVNMVLTDMMRTQTENDSARLGNYILKRFARYSKLRQGNVDKADFVVLRSLDIPSILIELGFISNAQDEKLLMDRTFKRKMAASIADSVVQYLQNTVLS